MVVWIMRVDPRVGFNVPIQHHGTHYDDEFRKSYLSQKGPTIGVMMTRHHYHPSFRVLTSTTTITKRSCSEERKKNVVCFSTRAKTTKTDAGLCILVVVVV
jgi:hypothetical protein